MDLSSQGASGSHQTALPSTSSNLHSFSYNQSPHMVSFPRRDQVPATNTLYQTARPLLRNSSPPPAQTLGVHSWQYPLGGGFSGGNWGEWNSTSFCSHRRGRSDRRAFPFSRKWLVALGALGLLGGYLYLKRRPSPFQRGWGGHSSWPSSFGG